MAYAISASQTRFSAVEFARNALRNFSQAAAQHRAFLRTRNELLALSDAMLADLGLTRSEINRVALEASIGANHP